MSSHLPERWDGSLVPRSIQQNRIKQLEAERRQLLQAHYAGAVPLDLLKEEQDRIAAEMANAGAALASTEIDWEMVETNLDKAIKLATNLDDAYAEAGSAARRMLVQTVFQTIEVDVLGLTPHLGDPFASLLAEDLIDAIEGQNKNHDPENQGRGLKDDILVEVRGFEPLTP